MKIKLLPLQTEIEADPNKSVLKICQENNIYIRSVCRGVPSCAECRVKVIDGENNVFPPTKTELSLIGTNYFIDGRRLSCQLRCFGDITIDISEHDEMLEGNSKKIRGFRLGQGKSANQESKAVQDTMILEENKSHKDTKKNR